MIHRDCFAYKTDCCCTVLNELVCAVRKCSFYKTKKQYSADLRKYPPIRGGKNG